MLADYKVKEYFILLCLLANEVINEAKMRHPPFPHEQEFYL